MTILMLIFVFFVQGPKALAENFHVTCVSDKTGKMYAPSYEGRTLGLNYFENKKDCQEATQSASSGFLCVSVDGSPVIYSLKKKASIGEYPFEKLSDCTKSVKAIKNNFVCTEGRKYNAIYDLEKNRFVNRYYQNSLDECIAAASKDELKQARNEVIAPKDIHNCETMTRLDSFGGSMEHVAVRDQGDAPICFGEVAAQMSDAWRFSNEDTNYDFQTSGLIASLQTYNEFKTWELANGGFTYQVMDTIIKNGSCSKAATMESLGADQLDTMVRLLKKIRVRAYNFKKILETNTDKNSHFTLNAEEISKLKLFFDNQKCFVYKGFAPDMKTVITLLEQADPLTMLYKQLSYACTGANHITPKPPRLETTYLTAQSPTEVANVLTSLLQTKTDLPVGVGICSRILDDANYRNVFPTQTQEESSCSSSSTPHAMIMIGKRMNQKSGRCEILLRNSYGTECGGKKTWECDKGNIWMDAEALSKNIYSIDTFKTEKK